MVLVCICSVVVGDAYYVLAITGERACRYISITTMRNKDLNNLHALQFENLLYRLHEL